MKHVIGYALFAAAAVAAVPASAATLIVDVTGAQSFAAFGTAGNEVRTFNIGANSRITAVAYNVTITAFDPSYLSEARLAFTESDTDGEGVFLTPGVGRTVAGTETFSSSANLIDLDLDFAVGADGILRLEWFESFNDTTVNPDAIWNSGTVTFTYEPEGVEAAIPEPATWAMMIGGFGMMGASLRRRRSTSVRFAA